MSWCKRCGEYDVWGKGCGCKLAGRAWRPESGETESDAQDVWAATAYLDTAIRQWAARLDSRNCYECFASEQVIAVRVAATNAVEYFNITRESEPVYYVNEACDSDRERARRQQARTLRSQRKYDRERRERRRAEAQQKATSP